MHPKSEKLKMAIAKQLKSDSTLVSYNLTSSVSARASRIRYGNKEEMLKFFFWYQISLDSLFYKAGIHMSTVYKSFTK